MLGRRRPEKTQPLEEPRRPERQPETHDRHVEGQHERADAPFGDPDPTHCADQQEENGNAHDEAEHPLPGRAAAIEGHTATVAALLEKGADVDAATGEGLTALMFAVDNGHIATVEVLLNNGASVNTKDGNGFSAVFHTVFVRNLSILNLLLQHGADVNAVDQSGWTPLMRAADR